MKELKKNKAKTPKEPIKTRLEPNKRIKLTPTNIDKFMEANEE